MAKKKIPGNPKESRGFHALVSKFIEWMEVQNWSEVTIKNRRFHLIRFIEWCDERGISYPNEVTKPILDHYKRRVHLHRKKDGTQLTIHSQRVVLTPVRTFFRWLSKQGYILSNPAAELELPKKERHLPKHILSADEVEKVLAQVNIDEPMGIRNRAILETLYSTGIRRAELTNLRLYDIDMGRGIVQIRQGKGRKDRFIPIGDRAIKWIDKYVREVRTIHAREPSDGPLFVSYRGGALKPDSLSRMTKGVIDRADLNKTGSCHIFRHTTATLMLEGGADVRHVQEMLGHESLTSTQIYTHVAVTKLKEVHEKTHPAGGSGASETPSEAEGEQTENGG